MKRRLRLLAVITVLAAGAAVPPATADATVRAATATVLRVSIDPLFGVRAMANPIVPGTGSVWIAGGVEKRAPFGWTSATAGLRVTLLYRAPGRTWRGLVSVQTNSWSRYLFSLANPRTGSYRVVLAGAQTSDVFAIRRTVKGFAVLAAMWPTSLPTPEASRTWFWVSVQGTTWGKDRRALVQAFSAGRWRTIQTTSRVTSTPSSMATIMLPRFTKAGSYRVYIPCLGMSVAKVYAHVG